MENKEDKDKNNNSFWVAGIFSTYLGERGLVRSISDAKRFSTKESAEHFIFGDRKRCGDSWTQLVSQNCVSKKFFQNINYSTVVQLKLEPTSILENKKLMIDKILELTKNNIC